MSKRYTSGVVSSTSPTVNAAGASGVFTLNQQSAAQSTNNWPPYKIEKSLRFRNSASARLTRTPAVAGNKQIWTMSFWLKTSKSNFDYYLFESSTDGGNNERTVLAFNGGKLQFRHIDGGSAVLTLETTQLFRDPSAWYHIVLAVDTTQATSSNRVKMYLNGSQITAFGTSTYPSQNLNTDWNGATAHAFGASTYPDSYSDGYFSEIYNIDGQALTPSSFGATDKDGNWSPIAYTGTYGTNGFYLNFKDSTSAATTGYDYSGNGNNWTLSGFNVSTANTTYDIMIDVPEDQSDGTANNRGNYATFNPLEKGSNVTLSEGNLKYSTSSVSGVNGIVSMRISTDMKSYFEFTCGSVSLYRNISIGGMTYVGDSGSISGGTGGTGTFATWTTGDVIRFACDYNAGTIACYKNATLQTTVTGITNTSDWVINAAQSTNTTGEYTANFGQRPFAYEPPSGFKALNTFNLPEPTIKQPNKHFDALIWTGDGTNGRNITGYGFSPEFLWIKKRSGAEDHKLNDIVRGVDKQLMSNRTEPEYTNTDQVRAFLSNGFTTDSSGSTNGNGATYVGWAWNAGGSTVTNTAGSISAQVRSNPTAGFSVVTYSGNGTSGATVGHGLGVKPAMVIIKGRNASTGASEWVTQHQSLSGGVSASSSTFTLSSYTSVVYLSGTYAAGAYGFDAQINGASGTYVAYCFAQVAGYSAFGSYTGNGSSDGTFVFTGFRPRYVMLKRTNTTGDWIVYDAARSTYNGITSEIYPNLSNAEDNSNVDLDFVSNGIKFRNSGFGVNGSGDTYIYAAFAEAPFKYARSR